MKELEQILLKEDIVTAIKENEIMLFSLMPELKTMVDFPHNHPHHHLDVWNHTLLALSFSEPDLEIRLALLLHDIGKPVCYQDEEVRHFRRHPYASYLISVPILTRLGYSKNEIDRISFLVVSHDTQIDTLLEETSTELIQKLLKIQYCDAKAHHPDFVKRRIQKLDFLSSMIDTKLPKLHTK